MWIQFYDTTGHRDLENGRNLKGIFYFFFIKPIWTIRILLPSVHKRLQSQSSHPIPRNSRARLSIILRRVLSTDLRIPLSKIPMYAHKTVLYTYLYESVLFDVRIGYSYFDKWYDGQSIQIINNDVTTTAARIMCRLVAFFFFFLL